MKETLIALALLTTGCVTGERMVRIVETGANAGYGVAAGEVHGVRVEASAEQLPGDVHIRYVSEDGIVVVYDSNEDSGL